MKIIFVFILFSALQSYSQDRGGLNTLAATAENTGVNAELKKRLSNTWMADKNLDSKLCKCWPVVGRSFFLNLNSDGTFTSESWSALKQTQLSGVGDATYNDNLYANSETSGTWSIADFFLTLRYDKNPPLKFKIIFKSADQIILQGKYTSNKYSKEIDLNLPMVKSLVSTNPASGGGSSKTAGSVSGAILGKWAYYEGKDAVTFEFKDDQTGTFMLKEKRRTVGSKYTFTFVTWSISDDGKRIVMKDKYSNEEYLLEILAITPNQSLMIKDEDGVELTLQKTTN